jgi:hypothetical protein
MIQHKIESKWRRYIKLGKSYDLALKEWELLHQLQPIETLNYFTLFDEVYLRQLSKRMIAIHTAKESILASLLPT